MTSTKTDDQRAAQERAEREEMFSFHPEILADAAPVPRKSDGSDYNSPASDGQAP